jgi:hypothetical protein
MTPAQLHHSRLLSLINQRDDLVDRLMDVNQQIEDCKKEQAGI